MSTIHTIGDLIRTRREALSLTAKQLQERVGCSRVTIWNYENGKRRPIGDELVAVLRALEIADDDPLFATACRLSAVGGHSSAPDEAA